MDDHNDTERGDLRALLGVLRRRLILIVLAVVAAVGVAIGISALQTKQYQSTSTLLFRPLLLDVQVTGVPLQAAGNPDRDAETNLRLVDTVVVRQLAARSLGPGFTAGEVDKDTTVTAAGQSNLALVTATSPVPSQAERIANAVSQAAVVVRRQSIKDQVATAISNVRRTLNDPNTTRARSRVLRRNLQRLQNLNLVETGDVQIAERAQIPVTPSSPKPKRDAVIGGGIGLLLGLALALGAEQLDRRIRRPDQLEDTFDLPVLAAVPRSKAYRGPKGWRAGLPGREAEAFRRLRANLRYYGKRDETRSVLVTSADAGSGKTTVALQLAAAAAAAGLKVLLIEADLRRPTLSGVLDLPADEGLSGALENDQPIESIPSSTVTPNHREDGRAHHDGSDGSFRVILAGRPLADASELLDSDAMRSLLARAHDDYELTVIDGPPPRLVSDVIPLMHQVDGVIVVSRLGQDSREALGRLRTDLRRLGVQPLGIVANFASVEDNPYYGS